ncbi:hypothetical protein Btru_000423 [Bulinus truncatus]|nr:hypothetical protein Btru_000423 [Bulinus truncatus]
MKSLFILCLLVLSSLAFTFERRADYVICEMSCGATNQVCIDACVRGKRQNIAKRVDYVICEMVICPNDNGPNSPCMNQCLHGV